MQLRVLIISLGYFIYDTIACALIEDDRANAAHHLCSIAAVCVGIFQEWVSFLSALATIHTCILARPCWHDRGQVIVVSC